LNELALFAGAGGGILGGKILGWRTVCAVEIEEYCRSVLIARQNDRSLDPFPIWDDVRTFDGRQWRGIVDVVSAGFPCQNISVVGDGTGIHGAKSSLVFDALRIIEEVEPRFVWLENAPTLPKRGLCIILQRLASLGYVGRWGILGASEIGGLHKRKRAWVFAELSDSNSKSRLQADTQNGSFRKKRQTRRHVSRGGGGMSPATDWKVLEPTTAGMCHDDDFRVDRARAIGNGQVPLCAATAWRSLGGGA